MERRQAQKSSSELWAEFRFGVVGGLLSSPPEAGKLQAALKELSARSWKHPISGEQTRYGVATIERWYYRAKRERGSAIEALRRKTRADIGVSRVLDPEVKGLLSEQHRAHSSWSYKLHADNLSSEIVARKLSVALPSSAVVRRWMQSTGLLKMRAARGHNRAGALAARDHYAATEVRSFENEYVGGLWHLDYHHCTHPILLPSGRWQTPVCMAVLDDHSRLAAHVQWYLAETTENLVHAFCQALQKRGLPRLLLSDNGSPMMGEEFTSGLLRLGIVHETTLPYSPYQNGKQERFWGVLEGRCVAMLENCADLTLSLLNEATLAWVELEYNRTLHSEIGCAPLERFVNSPSVSRESPGSAELKAAFMRETTRTQRRSDGTVSINGKRFEVPARYRMMRELRLRYAEWDLSAVHLVDTTGTVLCPLYPQDKTANAAGIRRAITPGAPEALPPRGEMAPLLKKLMADYVATGFPPNYLPKLEEEKK
jgi:transposase InsO family protein